MLNYSQASIRSVSVHGVGNKNNEGQLRPSEKPLTIDGELLTSLLKTYFLSSFRNLEQFTFDANASRDVADAVTTIFTNPGSLHVQSVALASRLYDVTSHPNIKPGELYVVYFTDIEFQGSAVNAVGIFKSETRDNYIHIEEGNKGYQLSAQQGLSVNKLDKGCLVLNDDASDEYRVLLVDNANRTDAQFWKGEFLGLKPMKDAFHQTQNFMSLTKQFVDEQLDEEFSVSKADKADLLNRSMDFFKSNEQFSQKEFETSVLADDSVIESFRKYEHTHMTEEDITDNFEISAHAVKRQAKVFKSVIKLDKNFHIYIHGSRELIEKGYDDGTRRNYYKFFFDQES